MRFALTIIMLLAATSVAAGELYKWVDKDGNVHYSDSPREGAERVELSPPASFDAPRVQPRPRRSEDAPQAREEETFRYTGFHFISPKEDQVFWATGGQIPVYLDIEPRLGPGHRINFYFDGELTDDSPVSNPSITLTDVHRGAHTVRAVIIGRDGQEIANAGPVTFHVRQQSIQNPQNRARPGGN